MVFDPDRASDRADELRELRRELRELESEARRLDVELDDGALTQEIGLCERMAETIHAADADVLRREYEAMTL